MLLLSPIQLHLPFHHTDLTFAGQISWHKHRLILEIYYCVCVENGGRLWSCERGELYLSQAIFHSKKSTANDFATSGGSIPVATVQG